LRQQHPSLPTILITGETSSAHLNAAQASGIPLVHKPVAIDKLKQLIAEVCA
jgi:DNA-binding NtrC family response regulator